MSTVNLCRPMRAGRFFRFALLAVAIFLAGSFGMAAHTPTAPSLSKQAPQQTQPSRSPSSGRHLAAAVNHTMQRLSNGNTLVAICYDIADNEVVEIDPSGDVVWRWGGFLDEYPLNWLHSAHLRESDGLCVITDTNNDRVIVVNRAGEIVWEWAPEWLDYPNDADWLPSGNILVSARDNNLILEVNWDKEVVWQYGGVDGPHNPDRLANGNTLIANSMRDRVIEVSPEGEVVWEYATDLLWPRDADRLANGNTLITDSRHHRVIEVTPAGEVVWEYGGVTMVYDADRLPNGNTMMTQNRGPGAASVGDWNSPSRVLEVDRHGRVVWQWEPERAFRPGGFQYAPYDKTSQIRQQVFQLLDRLRGRGLTVPVAVAELLQEARTAFVAEDDATNSRCLRDARDRLREYLLSQGRGEVEIHLEVMNRAMHVPRPIGDMPVSVFGTSLTATTAQDSPARFTLPTPLGSYMAFLNPHGQDIASGRHGMPSTVAIGRQPRDSDRYGATVWTNDLPGDHGSRSIVPLTFKVGFLARRSAEANDAQSLTWPELPGPTLEGGMPEGVAAYTQFVDRFPIHHDVVRLIVNGVRQDLDEEAGNTTALARATAEWLAMQIRWQPVDAVLPDVSNPDWQARYGCATNGWHLDGDQLVNNLRDRWLPPSAWAQAMVTLLRAAGLPARFVRTHRDWACQWWLPANDATAAAPTGRWVTLAPPVGLADPQTAITPTDGWFAQPTHNADVIFLAPPANELPPFWPLGVGPETMWRVNGLVGMTVTETPDGLHGEAAMREVLANLSARGQLALPEVVPSYADTTVEDDATQLVMFSIGVTILGYAMPGSDNAFGLAVADLAPGLNVLDRQVWSYPPRFELRDHESMTPEALADPRANRAWVLSVPE